MSFKEEEIRPSVLLNEYLRLSEQDGKKVLERKSDFFDRNCPGCDASTSHPAFQKNGFHLVTCDECQSLYVNPAPRMDAMEEFYSSSPSADYWAETFFPAVTAARRNAIYRPRASRVLEIANRYKTPLNHVTDVGAGAGLFLEEFGKQNSDSTLNAVEPGKSHVLELRAKGIRTFDGFSSAACCEKEWSSTADIVTCFEVLEHVSEPQNLLSELRLLSRPGGLIIVTGLSGTGFDIQTLGKNSKPVSPPHHLTFLSISGTEKLVKRCGLELLEITTPGELDVDIVRNAGLENPDVISDPFLKNLILDSSDTSRLNFQKFLKENTLSSHMWIVARRPANQP